ncbi:MAG: DUF4249 domain-containing protein [Muribaculaceae bacterium]|nr:DUF4249 domain-containing protein [Muribaculaceae bacterium]
MRHLPTHRAFPAALILAAASSCTGDPPAPAPQRLVVEGRFDSGSYPEVLLNMSMVPSDEEGSVAESIVRWGVVSISDGEREVILTGGPSDKHFPPYRYYTYQMEGEPGKTYTLRASYRGMTVSSTATMPAPTPIGSLEATPAEGNDTLRHVSLRFTAPDDTPAYYHLSARAHSRDGRASPCLAGPHEVLSAGAEVVLPVYRGNRYTDSDISYEAGFPAGETLTVTLARVSREVYLFWRAFDNASLVNGSVFVGAPGSLPSNIEGGYGVWSPPAAATATILLR